MNGAQINAWFDKNKKPALAVGAVVAGGLGLMTARRKASQPDGETPPASLASAGSPGAIGARMTGTVPVAGYAAYDSSASDGYNALQPQIERLGQMIQQQNTPIPVSVAPGFYGRAGGTGIYQVDERGNRDWLGMDEYVALGAPQNVTKVARDSSFWTNTTPVGADLGTWNGA